MLFALQPEAAASEWSSSNAPEHRRGSITIHEERTVKQLINRLQNFVAAICNHRDFGGILDKMSERSANRRELAQDKEDIRLGAFVAMWEFAQMDPPRVRQPFSRRFSAWFFTEGYLLDVSNESPLPQEVHYAIRDLCDNVAPRQRPTTPRQFANGQDRKVVRQGGRHTQASVVKQNGELLTADIGEPLAQLMAQEEREAKEARNQRVQAKVAEVIQRLTPTQKEVIRLRLAGFSQAEIARDRGVSQSAVSQTWDRIEEIFRQRGEEYFFGD
jgi:RNA polymerase sigma factor (sigma-70 family)